MNDEDHKDALFEQAINFIRENLKTPILRAVMYDLLEERFGFTKSDSCAVMQGAVLSGHIKTVRKYMIVWDDSPGKPLAGATMKNVLRRNATDMKVDFPKSQWWGPYPRLS